MKRVVGSIEIILFLKIIKLFLFLFRFYFHILYGGQNLAKAGCHITIMMSGNEVGLLVVNRGLSAILNYGDFRAACS